MPRKGHCHQVNLRLTMTAEYPRQDWLPNTRTCHRQPASRLCWLELKDILASAPASELLPNSEKPSAQCQVPSAGDPSTAVGMTY